MMARAKKERAPRSPAEGGVDGAGHVEKIREIIFGGQMRDYEDRFARLEERNLKERAELRSSLERRLDALDGIVRQEVDALAGRIGAEQAERAEALKDLAREVRDAVKALEKRLGQLEKATGKTDQDLHDRIVEQAKAFAADLQEKADRLSAAIGAEAARLRTDKVDRAAMAALLSDVARRLAEGSEVPGE